MSVDIVDKMAAETYYKIKALRKSLPQNCRANKDALMNGTNELKDKWWEDCKGFFK